MRSFLYLLALILLGQALISPQSFADGRANLRFQRVGKPIVSRLQADRQGIRKTQLYRQVVSQEASLVMETSASSPKRFGIARLDRTLESQTEFRLETGKASSDLWTTRIASSTTQQDVGLWGPALDTATNSQRAYTISHGWLHRLTENLSMEIFLGVAGCSDASRGDSKILPTGGLSLAREFVWGSVAAAFSHEAAGNGSLSGIYGSQSERRFALNGKVSLSENLKLLWDCGVILAEGAFQTVGMVKDAPVFVSGLGMEYSVNDSLLASVQYMHRRLIGTPDLLHGFEGPAAYASLRYLFN